MDIIILSTTIAWFILGLAGGWLNCAFLRLQTKTDLVANMFLGAFGAQFGGWAFVLHKDLKMTALPYELSLASTAAAMISALILFILFDQVFRQWNRSPRTPPYD